MNRTARTAGLLHLLLVPLGVFSFVYVPSAVLVRGDAAATASNLLTSELLFRFGILSHLISQVLVVFLVLALYRVFSGVDQSLARPMVALALLCVPVSFVSEVNNLAALGVLQPGGDGAFTSQQLQTQTMLYLELGRKGILLAQIFWGLWMLPLAMLVWRSHLVPKLLGVAIAIAGAGYLFDSVAQLLFPGTLLVSQFTVLAELLLPLWLLVKGVDGNKER